jgi:hypothetical protein
MNIENPMMLFYATSGWKCSKVASLSSQQTASLPESSRRPRNWNPVDGGARNWAFPATQGPKTGGPAKELSQTQAPTQACEAAAQVRSGQFTLGAELHSHSSGLLTHGSG